MEEKRRLIVENEFGQALKAMKRTGNTLSAILRQVWDCSPLGIMARSNRDRCEHPHISIVASITNDELQSLINQVDKKNGLLNRFLVVCAKRGRVLPHGGKIDQADLAALALKVRDVLAWAHGKHIVWGDAKDLWAAKYQEMSERYEPGQLGEITARAEAYILRIALVITLLHKSEQINECHLKAALEVWRFCEESARYIFGAFRNLEMERRIYEALCKQPGGLTKTAISKLFYGHKTAQQIKGALAWLGETGMAQPKKQEVDGEVVLVWVLL